MLGEKLRLPIGERLHSAEPQIATKSPHPPGEVVGEACQPVELQRPGPGEQLAGNVGGDLGETIEGEAGIGAGEGGSDLDRQRREPIELDLLAGVAEHFGHLEADVVEVIELDVAIHREQFAGLFDREPSGGRGGWLGAIQMPTQTPTEVSAADQEPNEDDRRGEPAHGRFSGEMHGEARVSAIEEERIG